MKTKFLVSLIALLAAMSFVATGVLATGFDTSISNFNVNVNGIDISGNTNSNALVSYTGDTLVVRVSFTSSADYSGYDAKIRVWINGKEAETSVKNIVLTPGTHYQYLVLKVPSDSNDDSLKEKVTLNVRVEAGANSIEKTHYLTLQRNTYDIEILDVDNDKTVKAGNNLPVTVVLKNAGYRELKNVFVVVSIPELEVEKKAYFEDLTPTDTCDDCDKRDSAERTLSLRIPTNAKAGVYEMKIEAYNSKSSDVITRSIVVVGSEDESRVVVPIASKDFNTGESASYDVVIVNAGSKVGVYEIVPEAVSGLTITTNTPIVTIPAGLSQTVKVDVKATREGSYNLAVGITSDGKLVKRVPLTANVDAGSVLSGNIAVLAIILAIVFVVLLIVLIVLLTRKPAKSEELEESYY